MTAVCRRITDQGLLVSAERAEVRDPEARTRAHYWVDLTAPTPDEVQEWCDALGAPALIRELADEPATTRVFGVPEAVWFSVPAFASAGDSQATPLYGVAVAGVLVTMHQSPSEALESARAAMERNPLLEITNTSGLMARLCTQVGYRTVATGKNLRAHVRALALRMEGDPDTVDVDEILRAAGTVDDLDAVVEDQLYWLRALKAVAGLPLNLQMVAEEMDVSIGNLVFLERTVDRLEKRIDDLRSRFDLLLSERTNRRLGFLTILSAVFLPLTLIAGIYGMNFEGMPELSAPFAYPIALASMAVIALAMLWYFRRKGWFE